ncbi:hypothetical protein OH492_26375 [Vibrio chagasii]|nr:hypothetical protein [Vibrio chagasii]
MLSDVRVKFDMQSLFIFAKATAALDVSIERGAARDGAEISGHPLSGHVGTMLRLSNIEIRR